MAMSVYRVLPAHTRQAWEAPHAVCVWPGNFLPPSQQPPQQCVLIVQHIPILQSPVKIRQIAAVTADSPGLTAGYALNVELAPIVLAILQPTGLGHAVLGKMRHARHHRVLSCHLERLNAPWMMIWTQLGMPTEREVVFSLKITWNHGGVSIWAQLRKCLVFEFLAAVRTLPM